MRILTDIPDEDIERLDAVAERAKCSRAAAIREAVRLYLLQKADNHDWIDHGFGLWKGRVDIADGVAYQQALREDRTPSEDL